MSCENISWCYPKIINKISEGSNDMSGGEIAALIAAVAFVVLVIFLVLVLYKVSQVVSKLKIQLMKQIQQSKS